MGVDFLLQVTMVSRQKDLYKEETLGMLDA